MTTTQACFPHGVQLCYGSNTRIVRCRGCGMNIDPAFATKQRRLPLAGSTTTGEGALSAQEEAMLKRVAIRHSNGDSAQQLGILVPAAAEPKVQAVQKLGLRTCIDGVRYAERQEWKREEPGDT